MYVVVIQKKAATQGDAFCSTGNTKQARKNPSIVPASTITNSFNQIYNSNKDNALITLCVFPIIFCLAAFCNDLLLYTYRALSFTQDGIWQIRTQCGQRHLVIGIVHLGLMLAWTFTNGTYLALQMIFGLMSSVLSRMLWFRHWIVIRTLMNHPHAEVWMLTPEEMEVFVTAIRAKNPVVLDDFWGTMDGL